MMSTNNVLSPANGAPIMDARRCISYLTIEHRGGIPLELRPLLGNRVFGCDICQEVCPFTRRFAERDTEPDYAPRPHAEAPSLLNLLRMTREEWEGFSRGSAIRRAGYDGFKRNVAVAAGNWLAAAKRPSANEAPRPVASIFHPSPLDTVSGFSATC